MAGEAMTTGASSYVEPVVAIDGTPVGDGEPGDLTLRLRSAHLTIIRSRSSEG
ncbi:MAG: hypothetical protein QF575_04835 [Acidimicrobiales bacterium]|nr:hypothetical protein [Acidimicrobiales bacterium]